MSNQIINWTSKLPWIKDFIKTLQINDEFKKIKYKFFKYTAISKNSDSIKEFNIARDLLNKLIIPVLKDNGAYLSYEKDRNTQYENLEDWIKGGLIDSIWSEKWYGEIIYNPTIRGIDQVSSYLGCMTNLIPCGAMQNGKGPDGCFQLIKVKCSDCRCRIKGLKLKLMPKGDYDTVDEFKNHWCYLPLHEWHVWNKYYDFGTVKMEYVYWSGWSPILKDVALDIYKQKTINPLIKGGYCKAIGMLAQSPYTKGQNKKDGSIAKVNRHAIAPLVHIAILSWSRIKQLEMISRIADKGGEVLLSCTDAVTWVGGPTMQEMCPSTKILGEYYPIYKEDQNQIYMLNVNGYIIGKNNQVSKFAHQVFNADWLSERDIQVYKWIINNTPFQHLPESILILNNDCMIHKDVLKLLGGIC